jgi:hypothetical protein
LPILKWLALGVVLGAFVSLLFSRRRRIAATAHSGRAPDEAPAPAAVDARTDTDTAGDAAPDDDLERLTRPELYRRAAAAGIVGRSEMSKAELIAALRGGASGAPENEQ